MPGVIDKATVARHPSAWTFAGASGGIVNTATAVTLIAAPADATQRNYLTDLYIATDTLGAVTELAIRDGAGGTVLFRTRLQTAALVATWIGFSEPLMGTKGNLLEVVTLTAVTGGVWVNAAGYIGVP